MSVTRPTLNVFPEEAFVVVVAACFPPPPPQPAASTQATRRGARRTRDLFITTFRLRFATMGRKLADNSNRRHPTPSQITLAVVLQVRGRKLHVLLWQRAQAPFRGSWSLPGGRLESGETLEESIRRQLEAKVDVHELAHLEQLETLSDPSRVPHEWQLATAYVGLVPSDVDTRLPGDTAWHAAGRLPKLAFDHRTIVLAGLDTRGARLGSRCAERIDRPSRGAVSPPLAACIPSGLPRRPRQRRGRGHRAGILPRGGAQSRPLRSSPPVRSLAAQDRRQPRHRLVACTVTAAGGG